MSKTLLSNMVKQNNLREVQLNTLNDIASKVMCTAGPYGSETIILKDNALPIYTKDGKHVLENIQYFGVIENNIVEEIKQLTTKIVKEVGDGTTTAISLSSKIFKGLYKESQEGRPLYGLPPRVIINTFKRVIKNIEDTIRDNGKELTLEDINKICMISTNGNELLSNHITTIYEKYGLDVDITLDTTSTSDFLIKEFAGMVINKGYATNAYVNTITDSRSTCTLDNPRLYFFQDPITTKEQAGLFTKILYDNIISKVDFSSGAVRVVGEFIPTAIFAPGLGRDIESTLNDLESIMYSFMDPSTRPPVCIVINMNRYLDDMDDMVRLCNGKVIKKYIDADIQKADIEKGLAPTVDNVSDFYGSCERFIADSDKSVFITPEKMYLKDEEGNYIKDADGNNVYSDTYNMLMNYLITEIARGEEEGAPLSIMGPLKRRLRKFKQNMVEFFVGGQSTMEVTALKDAAEDAILNCRSASIKGVGRGLSFEGYMATRDNLDKYDMDNVTRTVYNVIKTAYYMHIINILETAFSSDMSDAMINEMVEKGVPINIRTEKYDGSVLTSIDSDIVTLDIISRIIVPMLTANQLALSSPSHNVYIDNDQAVIK